MSDETPAQARRRRRRASSPNVDLTEPDTETLEGFRRLRGTDHHASSPGDRAPSVPRPIRRGTRPPGPAASTAPAEHDAPVEKGANPC